MSIAYDFTKEPSELVEYLKSKGLQTTFNYEEMLHEAHQKAFTVAKVTKLDLLSDIHSSLGDALKEGKPFSQWQDEIRPTLQEKGWWGEVEAIDPRTGEVKEIFVGSRRLKTIYNTNMRTAYAKGRYEAQIDSDAEYFYYASLLEGNRRPLHKAKHGTLLPKTDPWWNTNYPPNGWGCKCKVRSYTKQEVLKRGLKVSQRPENIADKDWAYNPGKVDYFDTYGDSPCGGGGENAKKHCTNKISFETDGLPKLQELPKELIKKSPAILEAGVNREEGYRIIKEAILGTKKEIVLSTPIEKIIITDLILNHAVKKEPRERYANFMIETLLDPLEIWFTRFDDGNIRPQYIAMFDHPTAILVSVVLNRDGSLAWNFMNSSIPKMNKNRIGEWMWKKY